MMVAHIARTFGLKRAPFAHLPRTGAECRDQIKRPHRHRATLTFAGERLYFD